jgi:hypothetical protein
MTPAAIANEIWTHKRVAKPREYSVPPPSITDHHAVFRSDGK